MPLFISNEEFQRCSHDVSLVAEKADSFIRDLQRQLETVRAQADAASITAEQTCSLLEQKFLSLSSDFDKLESQNAQLSASIEQRVSELAEVQSEKHKIHLELIGKDGEIERLSTELSELHKSKRQILDLVEQKDSEINEKNATIKSYLDKIVSITDAAAVKQAQLHDKEAELARSNATCARLSQEKELIERHNKWLNEELTAKVQDLIEARKTHNEVEADISSKLGDVEKQFSECSSSLKWYKTRVTELEAKITSLQDELCSSREAAATDEERFSAEVATVTKLVGLYKESSEEWSKKAGELEGVIKALETHLNQIESDYKETLQKEVDARKLHEKEAADLKEKVEKCEAELEKYRKANELCLLPISSFVEETWAYRSDADDIHQNDHMPVPKIPAGVSGTALAASLLRDGWSLAKMYEKYQEAVDALRHESMGRKQSQAILERVLYEIEEKAEIILDERAEHEKMADAYSVINQKLQESVSEQAKLEGRIQELKAELFRSQREYDVSQKEITDLQKQVTVLLKECRDIQVRCGSASNVHADACAASSDVDMDSMSDIERVISERLLTFKDINELVEQNVKLRSLVRSLSDQNEKRDTEMREMFEMELQKQTDKAASKVAVVLDRAEEQGKMIESLHSSVAMYKRLYEEELKHRSSYPTYSEAVTDPGRRDHMLLLENSEDASKKAKEQAVEHVKRLEEELEKFRNEAISLRLERDKLSMESNFARERLDRFMKEFDHQRDEMNGVLSRNIEFSQLVVDYQRKIRESSDTLHAAEELSRKLDVEVTLLKHEKQLLVNSEKRACDEIRSLSERVHRLQASLDTIHSVEEVREEARVMEIRKKEDYLKQVERDWAEVKKELQEERDNVRTLTRDREHTIKDAMRQVEELGKRLAETLRAVSLAESRAAVAEARYSDIEAKYMHFQDKAVDGGQDPSTSLTSEETMGLHKVREELEKLKAEAQANKDHMLQYKNIAQVNEAALKQIESAHERFKVEADKTKKSLEAEILSLRERLSEHESDSSLKSREAASAVAEKEEALRSALVEIDNLKEENCMKMSQITGMEVQISSLKENVEEEHRRWRTAQNNYERQVILQSETIQELTKTSQALGLLQEEVSHLRKLSDTQKNEIHILKDQLASEKSVLSRLKDEAEEKYNEVNGQNKILHARLEALHIKLAEKERHTSGSTGHDPQGDGDLQTVVSYLRRSKEIAETEISLLKQEKHRLQSQLESALKASETVQTQLQAERANSRSLLFSDEDFKSLQIQVREMNLLRESNLQLREENKHNFEECQKLRELAQNTRVEMEHLKTMLREKEIEVESCRKEIEMQKIEKGSLESRIVDLLAMCKNVDLEDYNRIKDEYQQMQVKLRAVEAELDETRKLVSEKQYSITRMEQELANTRAEFAERETRINEFLQSEATLKLNADRLRRVASQLKKKSDSLTTEKEEWSNEKQTLLKQLEDSRQVKRPLGDTSGEHLFKKKLETLTKEKEELINEKQTLLKQLEDSRQVKRPLGDTSSEQTMKEKEQEKDTRIQMLEKTLERERDKFKKEKSIRATLTKTVLDKFNTVKQEQDKLVSELEKYRQNRESLLEGGLVAQTPENVVDNQAASYLAAVQNLDDMITNTDEFAGVPHSDTSTMDLSSVTAGRQVPTQTSLPIQPSTGTAVGSSQTKIAEEREKKSRSLKLKRPLIAPPRPQTPSGDTEMSEGNVEVKPQVQPSAPRKRIAPMAASESQTLQDGNSTVVPPQSKKSKSDVPEEGHAAPAAAAASVPSPPPPLPQSLEAPASTLDEASDAAGNQSHEVAEKDEVRAPSDIVVDEAPKEETLLDVHETQNDESIDAAEDLNDNTAEIEDDLGEGMKDEEEQEPPSEMESDREEGELPPEVVEEEQDGDDDGEGEGDDDGDGDGGDIEAAEDLASSVPEVAGEEEEPQVEVMETISSTVVNVDEKNDLVEGVEEMGEDSDKATDLVDDAETEKSPDTAIDGVGGSSSPSNASDPPTVSDVSKEDESPAERSATTTASTRLSGRLLLRSRTSAGSPSTTTARGGGAPSRGNRPRGGRFGRRSTSDESRG